MRMQASYYHERAVRCFTEARECGDVLIARMLEDLGSEFEELAREIEELAREIEAVRPRPSRDTNAWPASEHAAWRSHRDQTSPVRPVSDVLSPKLAHGQAAPVSIHAPINAP